MKILNTYPPNIKEIKAVFGNLPQNQIFAYGDIVYNPSGKEIPPDIQFHEQAHIYQQKKFPSADIWWLKYLNDKDFRKDEELEAYSAQYKFIKKFYPNKAVKEALNEMAENLSNNYKLGIAKSQAQTLIRKYEKGNL